MSHSVTTESFLKDVSLHGIKVLHDDGVYRHIRFQRPGTGCMHFDLVTYPGHLVYSGDMGCFVFQRLHDMFEFFRRSPEKLFQIDRRYWAEKCQAEGVRGDGIEEFDRELFKARINERMVEHVGDQVGDVAFKDRLAASVEDEILSFMGDYSEEELMRRAYDFQFAGDCVFQDFHEVRCSSYTQRFEWCCHALAWGIARYDATKERT